MDHMKKSEKEIMETQTEEIFIELSKYYMKTAAQEAEYKKMMQDMKQENKQA